MKRNLYDLIAKYHGELIRNVNYDKTTLVDLVEILEDNDIDLTDLIMKGGE